MTDEELAEHKQALALLSPEERAAMGEDEEEADIIKSIAKGDEKDTDSDDSDGTADKKDDQKQNGSADDEDEDDSDEDDDADDDVDAKDAKDDDADKAKQDDAAGTADATDDKQASAIEPIVADLTPIERAYQAQLEALDTKKAEQFQKLMDGEITAADYSKFESQYLRDRDAAAVEKADSVAWFTTVNTFMNKVLKDDGINYSADAEKNAAFDDWVKRLASNPKNEGKDPAWFLEEAHKKVKLEYGVAEQAAPAKQENKPAKPKGRAPDLTKLPPTLGGLPAAAENDAGDGGEFAHLEKLSGLELERALARMTADQRERYEMAS
jgi:hypothetical protein